MADLPAAGVKRLLAKHGGDLRSSTSAVHMAVAAAEEDIARDEWMKNHGLRVIRIPAVEISRNLENALEWIAPPPTYMMGFRERRMAARICRTCSAATRRRSGW